MRSQLVARWRDWSGGGLEHLALKTDRQGIRAEAAVVGMVEGQPFAVQYRIDCLPDWRVRSLSVAVIGGPSLRLTGNGNGSWVDEGDRARTELHGAIDVDLAITPFTNTLPIRRLGLRAGESREIVTVYVEFPDLVVSLDEQRYTCLEPLGRYRYEAVDGTFEREIEVDENGLVTTYPGLFQRIW